MDNQEPITPRPHEVEDDNHESRLPSVIDLDPMLVRNSMMRSPTDLPLYCMPAYFPPGELPMPVVSEEGADLNYHARVRALHWEMYREYIKYFDFPCPYDENIFPNLPGVFATDPALASQKDRIPAPPGLDRPNFTWVPGNGAPSDRHGPSHPGHPWPPATPNPNDPRRIDFPEGHWLRNSDTFQRLPIPDSTSERIRDAFYPRLGHHTNLLGPEDAARLWPAVVKERLEYERAEQDPELDAELRRRETEWRARHDDLQYQFDAMRDSISPTPPGHSNESREAMHNWIAPLAPTRNQITEAMPHPSTQMSFTRKDITEAVVLPTAPMESSRAVRESTIPMMSFTRKDITDPGDPMLAPIAPMATRGRNKRSEAMRASVAPMAPSNTSFEPIPTSLDQLPPRGRNKRGEAVRASVAPMTPSNVSSEPIPTSLDQLAPRGRNKRKAPASGKSTRRGG
ncbi:hypothetical protein QBC37DRAFT_379259 [Rhypophila decipiens]|uniref:Uncharacterized protein n=1 Tax=Rhypophila decipiens TaxID=261697 RepID=A0AAN6XX14_9PEZI|nr:hypothetical protein QBC37DRAFT_379259 [Rhypophila decipiens]